MNQRWVPVTEVDQCSETARLVWNYPLPEYLHEENILVNAPAIGRIAAVAALSRVIVVGEDGPLTKAMPMAVGNDSQGNLLAGMGGAVNRVPVVESRLVGAEYRSRPAARIAINSDEVMEHLTERRQLRDEPAWAGELNGAIKKGLAEAAKANLLTLDDQDRWFLACLAIATAVPSIFRIGDPEFWQRIPLNMLYCSLCLNIGMRARPDHKDLINSLVFPGYNIDRYVAARGLIKCSKLVRATKSQPDSTAPATE